MIQLLYISQASPGFNETALARILQVSAKNNARRDVTGLLLYSNHIFMQVLEGDENEVNATFARIRQDPRHYNVIVLVKTSIKAREFERWSMGFRRSLCQQDIEALPEYAPYFDEGFDVAGLSKHPDITLEIIRALAEKAEAKDFEWAPQD
jgi:hypothetical protein